MKVLIFGGFLGSGKTTCLMQLARYVVENSKSDKEIKVMILENEIGEVGIDDAFLRGGGFQVDNLFAGCACCSVSGEMVTAAGRIRSEYDPEWLIVETTGLAYPIRIQENLKIALDIESRIGVLVDASRWRRLRIPMENLLMGQIQGSDAVLVNKIDLVEEATVQAVDKDILFFEPKANIYHISGLKPVDGAVWKGVLGE
ncbi:MAG: cobalamin biosynthesis protein P47K [Oscillospiraceae bacterium]|nr:cobalamin biosynthesis protein P47K [Oscillospiraceae bacterium]